MTVFALNLNPASAHAHSVQPIDLYSNIKLLSNHNKDFLNVVSLYELMTCTAQARSLARSRLKFNTPLFLCTKIGMSKKMVH